MPLPNEKCGNPTCSTAAKLVCSACNSIAYCGSSCQKIHWKDHKIACKAMRTASNPRKESTSGPLTQALPNASQPIESANQSSSSSPTVTLTPVTSAYYRQLQELKAKIQANFQAGDLPTAIENCLEAIKIARLLPEPAAGIELIQLHLNVSNAYVNSNNPSAAEKHLELAVEFGEMGLLLRPGNPQAADLLSVALINLVNFKMNTNQITKATVDLAQRAVAVSEAIYTGANDIRNAKAYRCLGILSKKQDNQAEAEKYLTKAFNLYVDHSSTAISMELVGVFEELFSLMMMLGKHVPLEKLVKRLHDQVKDVVAKTASPEQQLLMFFSDICAKLASLLMHTQISTHSSTHNPEYYMLQTLSIRESRLGKDSLAVGMTLLGLAAIYEGMRKKPTHEIIVLLQRAHQIFLAIDGPKGVRTQQTLEHIKRLQQPETADSGGLSSRVKPVDDMDEDGVKIVSENKSSRSSPGRRNGVDDIVTDVLDPHDGPERMRKATYYYEQKKFHAAEVLMMEAANIFASQGGPEHHNTVAAKKNLMIVRMGHLNHLWQELAAEQIRKQEEENNGVNHEMDEVGGFGSSTKPVSPEDAWLLRQPTSTSQCLLS